MKHPGTGANYLSLVALQSSLALFLAYTTGQSSSSSVACKPRRAQRFHHKSHLNFSSWSIKKFYSHHLPSQQDQYRPYPYILRAFIALFVLSEWFYSFASFRPIVWILQIKRTRTLFLSSFQHHPSVRQPLSRRRLPFSIFPIVESIIGEQ